MDNPFSADNKANPFKTPYQQPQDPAASQGIKPFAAVELAPSSGHNGQRLNAPGNPTASAFTAGDFGDAFLSPQTPAFLGAPPMPPMQPSAAPQAYVAPVIPSNAFASMTSAQGSTYAPKPAPQALPDYTPVSNAIPAAARQLSRIVSCTFFRASSPVPNSAR